MASPAVPALKIKSRVASYGVYTAATEATRRVLSATYISTLSGHQSMPFEESRPAANQLAFLPRYFTTASGSKGDVPGTK